MATNSFIQVPPDSTGKRLYAQQHTVDALPVQAQVFHLGDSTNPLHLQHVDAQGQASMRFAEGSPSMAAFGDLRMSTGKTIGVYDFTTDAADELFSDVIVTGGSVNYLSNASTVALSVTSANGAFAGRTSDKYHFYWPGCGNLTLMTIALSDVGMTGCKRRWGNYDANNGIMFYLDAASVLNVSMKSSVTGSLVQTNVPQSSWNGDKLDGSGLSGMVLNVSKLNIYWTDFQWLGAGRVRMGVVDSLGNRVVCHTWENANANSYPYIQNGSLPISYDIENVALTSGAASIRLTCASVKTEGEINYTFWRYSYQSPSKNITGNNIPVITVKSLPQWNGKHNLTTAFPELFSCYVGGTGAVRIDLYWDLMDLVGANYILDNGSTVVADVIASSTNITTQVIMKSFYLDVGVHNINLSDIFETNDVALTSRANEGEPLQISFIATKLSGSPTIEGTINYRELR